MAEAVAELEEPQGVIALLSIPPVRTVITSYFLIVLISLSFDAVFIIWLESSTSQEVTWADVPRLAGATRRFRSAALRFHHPGSHSVLL